MDPADVVLKNLDLTDKGRFYVSEIKGDTDENGVASYFTVRLSSAPDDGNPGEDNVTITMASSDPDEGQISSSIGNQQTGDSASQLVFTSSNWNAERTVTVVGQPDYYSDGDQNYTIILGQDNDTADLRFRYVDPRDVSVTNLDLTGKGSYYVSAVSRPTDENGIRAEFSVRLATAPTDNVTIYLKTSDPSEGRISKLNDKTVSWSEDNKSAYVSLTILKDSWNSDHKVEVEGQWDNLSDGDQPYAIVLSSDNRSKDRNYRYVDPPDVSLTVSYTHLTLPTNREV